MASVDLLAGSVMDKAASLMNNTSRTVYTYAAQVPYLNIALQELQEEYALHAISVTEEVSAVISVPAGTTRIVFNGVGVPTLPDDMIEPNQLFERMAGGTDSFSLMTRRDFLPHIGDITIGQFGIWVWQSSEIRFHSANQANEVKINYIKELFQPVVNESSFINIISARTFLEYRTAGLLAEFIERNIPSAEAMNAYAMLAMNRAIGIGSKGKQRIMTRRRPFRLGYKQRGWVT